MWCVSLFFNREWALTNKWPRCGQIDVPRIDDVWQTQHAKIQLISIPVMFDRNGYKRLTPIKGKPFDSVKHNPPYLESDLYCQCEMWKKKERIYCGVIRTYGNDEGDTGTTYEIILDAVPLPPPRISKDGTMAGGMYLWLE